MGYSSTWIDDHLSALLMSLMATLEDQNPVRPCQVQLPLFVFAISVSRKFMNYYSGVLLVFLIPLHVDPHTCRPK